MARKASRWRSFRFATALVAGFFAHAPLISVAHAAPLPQATAGGNAADAWRQVFPLLTPRSDANPSGLLTQEEWATVQGLGRNDLSAAELEQAKVFLSKLQPAMSLISDAAAQKRCDFELDRSRGFEMLLPHLGPMREAARLLRLQGVVQLNAGDLKGFADTQSQIARVAVQPGQDEVVTSSMVGTAIARLPMGSVQAVIDEGTLTQQGARDLIEALAPLRGDDPMHFAEGAAREYEAVEKMLKLTIERRRDRSFHETFGINPRAAEQLLPSLPTLKPIYDLYGQALRETDPAKAKGLVAKANALADGLPENLSLLKALLPAFETVLRSRDDFRSNLAALLKTLEKIAADPSAAARYAKPAVLWARVAARVCALPNDSQTAVEILRAQGPEHAGEFAPRAIACLEGCDGTIFEAMRVAAACERTDLDFSKVPGLTAWPPLPTFGGLRGAARLAAARITLLDTDRAIAHLDLAFAAAAALARDPSQAASCTSLAIVRELVPAVAAIARRGDMNDERRARLEAAVHRIDRKDPFGFRASLAAERAVLISRLEPLESDHERLEKELRRKPADWVMAARIAAGDVHAPVTEAGPLEDIADLFPSDRLEKANTAAKAISDARNAAARDDAQPASAPRRSGIAALPIEPIRDPATDAQEAQATLSALDAALKPAPAAR